MSATSEGAMSKQLLPNGSMARAGQASWAFLVRVLLLWFIGFVAILIIAALTGRYLMPVLHENMAQTRIFAYRGWQSTGVRLEVGETAVIRAKGEWLYTPGEWHGANGHKRYPAPAFYPMHGVAGGVLIGRVGDSGSVQWVGERGRIYANDAGMLYLRINDDILSDNEGALDISIEVIPAPEMND